MGLVNGSEVETVTHGFLTVETFYEWKWYCGVRLTTIGWIEEQMGKVELHGVVDLEWSIVFLQIPGRDLIHSRLHVP